MFGAKMDECKDPRGLISFAAIRDPFERFKRGFVSGCVKAIGAERYRIREGKPAKEPFESFAEWNEKDIAKRLEKFVNQ